MVAPPPGLPRRPSMTVPWQVAESVLDAPAPGAFRFASPDGLASPTSSSSSKGLGFNRRGSFGNAAQFFKFRRRSKSRLEFARDAANAHQEAVGEEISRMPGIDESSENPFVITDLSSSSNPYGSLNGLNREGWDLAYNVDEDSYQVVDGQTSGSETLSPHLRSSMSPNGAKLRQVAELARRGSMTNEDKIRMKDEIISKSLAGSDNVALIVSGDAMNSRFKLLTVLQGKIKMRMSNRLSRARQSLEKRSISEGNLRPPKGSPPKVPSSGHLSPPPGFVATRSGAGIRRSSSLQQQQSCNGRTFN